MNRRFSKVPLRLRAWCDIHKIVSAPNTQLFISFPGVYKKLGHQCYLDAVTEKLLFAIGISWDLHDFCQRKINKYFHLHPLSLNDLNYSEQILCQTISAFNINFCSMVFCIVCATVNFRSARSHLHGFEWEFLNEKSVQNWVGAEECFFENNI